MHPDPGELAYSLVVSKEKLHAFPSAENSSRSPDERRDGRSPGSPINASGRLPGTHPSGFVAISSRLTVAGTAPDSHRLPS